LKVLDYLAFVLLKHDFLTYVSDVNQTLHNIIAVCSPIFYLKKKEAHADDRKYIHSGYTRQPLPSVLNY